MIDLYQLPGAWGVSSVSPFCVKVEAALRAGGLPFRRMPGVPFRGPRGKVPWIGLDGELIHDSQRILDELTSRGRLTLDAHLDEAARMRGHAIRRMLEEGTYFLLVYLRWEPDDAWAVYQPVLAAELPPVVGPVLLGHLRRGMRKMLWSQGTGRLDHERIEELACQDYAALSAELGDREFLFGSAPTTFDATAYAWVASTLAFPHPSRVKSALLADARLVAYRERFEDRFFRDGPR